MVCTGNCSYCKNAVFCTHPGVPKTKTQHRAAFARRLIMYAVLTVLLLVVTFEGFSSASLSGGAWPPAERRTEALSPEKRQIYVANIIRLFENRIAEGGMPAKAINKLVAMNDKELLLTASLCDRIAGAANREGADVALLLVTAMIVLT